MYNTAATFPEKLKENNNGNITERFLMTKKHPGKDLTAVK